MEISLSPSKTHVVILTSLGMGHIIPCLELSKSLVSLHDDLKVTLIIPNTSESSKTQTQLPTSLSPLLQELNIINLPPVDISVPDDLDVATHITTIVRESLPAVGSVIEKLQPFPTVLVTDLFGTDAFEVIADAFKMTKYLFFPSSLIALTFIAYLPKLDWKELTKGEKNEISELLIRVPGCRPVRVDELGDSFSDPNGGGYLCMLYHARRFVKLSGLLVNTFDDFETELCKSLSDGEIRRQIPLPRVYPVGPLIKSTVVLPDSQSNHPCLTWLDNQPCDSVLFVSFGSGAMLPAEQVTELAWGLELSQQRFIWVVRKPIDHSAITSAYLAAGRSEETDPTEFLPDGFLNRTRGVGLVVLNWAPQVEILSHGSVGGFLSHCGWNSTLESIVNGVPIIPWPLFAEQHLNASMLSDDVKIAVRSPVQKGKRGVVIGREEIERMARLIMEGEEGKELRRRAKELKNKALGALGKGGSSYNSLSQIAQKWKAESGLV